MPLRVNVRISVLLIIFVCIQNSIHWNTDTERSRTCCSSSSRWIHWGHSSGVDRQTLIHIYLECLEFVFFL